jgi:hypothetical protein
MAKSYDALWVKIQGAGERRWSIKLRAKIDTGAKRCSIDIGLATALGLEQIGETMIRSTMGRQSRPLFAAKMRVGGNSWDVEVTGADRV